MALLLLYQAVPRKVQRSVCFCTNGSDTRYGYWFHRRKYVNFLLAPNFAKKGVPRA